MNAAPDAPPGEDAAGQLGGVLRVLCAAALWSSAGLFIKLITVHPVVLVGVRAALAALTLLPFARLKAMRVDRHSLLPAVALAATQLCFVVATRWTTAANAIALQATSPAWVFVLGGVAARRVQLPLLPPILLILAGIATMLSEPTHGTSLQGNLLGLVGGFTFAVMQISLQRVKQPLVGVVVQANVVAALASFALAPTAFRLGSIPLWEWGVLVYLGAIQIGLALLLYMVGVQRIPVSQASMLVLLEPLLNPLWVFLVIGEVPSRYGFAGYALIFAGIALDTWLRLRLPSLRTPDVRRAAR